MTEAVREVIAVHIANTSGRRKSFALCDADNIIAALSSTGYVIVPKAPTAAMLSRGYATLKEVKVGPLSYAWQAMLRTSQVEPEKKNRNSVAPLLPNTSEESAT